MGKGGESASRAKVASDDVRKISIEELAKHRTPDDAWLAYKGRVYDVSNWTNHPGGSVIFTHAGDDCTDIFAAFHPLGAMKELQKFEIGVFDDVVKGPIAKDTSLIKTDKQRAFEKAYRELRHKLVTMGMFNASIPFYIYKVLSNVALLAISIYCTTFSSLAVNLVGAVIMGLFWQQCGWLAHDFLHHQVFKTRMYGDYMGLIIGNLFQGFSVAWWKGKHNAHHAVPNLHASVVGACDGDPDIDTMPYLAWSLKMAEIARDSAVGRFLISHQAVFYFPLLLFARMIWAYQSVAFAFNTYGQHSTAAADMDKKNMKYPGLEKLMLVLHYLSFFRILANMSFTSALAFFFVAQMSCGLMLAVVFGLGHNGMAVYPANERPDFWTLQVTTTRNISSSPFVDWFCGGLHYQVDHHLFPSLPRHNLKKVHGLVAAFCKEQGVSYHEAGIIEGTREVLGHLSEISQEFLKEFPGM